MAKGKFGIGRGLGGTQTSSTKGSTPPHGASSMARGDRKDPPKGCEFPGKRLASTQARNSLTTRR